MLIIEDPDKKFTKKSCLSKDKQQLQTINPKIQHSIVHGFWVEMYTDTSETSQNGYNDTQNGLSCWNFNTELSRDKNTFFLLLSNVSV